MPQHSEQDLHTMSNILQKIELFQGLNEQEITEVVKIITMDYFPENHLLFREGEFGDKMYIIKSGIVRLFHQGDSPSFDKEVAMLGDNDFFGEMALISDTPRNATAKVVEAIQVFVLTKADLMKLISENPTIAAKISSEFLDRLKQNLRDQNS